MITSQKTLIGDMPLDIAAQVSDGGIAITDLSNKYPATIVRASDVLIGLGAKDRKKYWRGFVGEDNEGFVTFSQSARDTKGGISKVSTSAVTRHQSQEAADAFLDEMIERKTIDRFFPNGDLPDNLPTLPMLASKTGSAPKSLPIIAHPYIGGYRMLTDGQRAWNEKGIVYDEAYSRPFLFGEDVLRSARESTGRNVEGMVIDGEVKLERRAGFGPSNIMQDLRFFAYDLYLPNAPDVPYAARLRLLKDLSLPDSFRIVNIFRYNNPGEEAAFLRWRGKVQRIYDGVVYRGHNTIYIPGHRSKDVLVQHFGAGSQDRAPIVDIVGGRGKDRGAAILVCKARDYIGDGLGHFRMRAPGTYAERKEMLAQKDKHLGRSAWYSYKGATHDGMPVNPVCRHLE